MSKRSSESIFADEAENFPRGGGSSLTPSTVRSAQLEGIRQAAKLAGSKKKKVKRDDSHTQSDNDTIRIEHLNYKRLVQGTRVLGQIVRIAESELIVALPNQLLGHVPLHQLSPEYTQLLNNVDSDEEEDDAEDTQLTPLDLMYSLGDWVSCIVTDEKAAALGRSDGLKVKSRRVVLSTSPALVNQHVSKDALLVGMTLTASVSSAEDRGYTLNLGIDGVSAFIASKSPLHIGQVVRVKLAEVDGRAAIATLDGVDSAVTPPLVHVNSILPGHLVSATVTACVASGVNVKFMGFYNGTVESVHLPGNVKVAPGAKFRARIMWENFATQPKSFSLSALPHAVSLDAAHSEPALPLGAFALLKTVAVDDDWGVLFDVVDEDQEPIGTRAFAHISRLSDTRVDSVSKMGIFRPNSIHKGRVEGFSPVDHLSLVSTKESLLTKTFLTVDDVPLGLVCDAHVKKFSSDLAIVSLDDSIDAVLWKEHFADAKLAHPDKKFAPGRRVSGIVFAKDASRARIVFSCRQSLIDAITQNGYLPLATLDDAAEFKGWTLAVVAAAKSTGVLVDVFGGIKAFLPAAETVSSVTPGSLVRIRITKVNRVDKHILVSQKDIPVKADLPYAPGDLVQGTITGLHQKQIQLALEDSTQAIVSYKSVARERGLTEAELRDDLAKGQLLGGLIVLNVNNDRRFVICAYPKESSEKQEPAPKKTQDVPNNKQPENLVSAVLDSVKKSRFFFKLPDGTTALAYRSKTHSFDLSKGDTVLARLHKSSSSDVPLLEIVRKDGGIVETSEESDESEDDEESEESEEGEEGEEGEEDAEESEESEEDAEESEESEEDVEESEENAEESEESDEDSDDNSVADSQENISDSEASSTGVVFGEAPESDEDALDAGPLSWKPTERKASHAPKKDTHTETTQLTSAIEFEKALLGARDSSLLWIQYMAMYVGQGEFDEARKIGRRAIETIYFREEQEKFNVWMALLNLENTYGNQDTFKATFDEALQRNDAQSVFLRAIEILEQSGKLTDAEDLLKKLVKKYASVSTWMRYAQFLFEQERADDARALLPRSIQSLGKSQHVSIASQFAQLEFKWGDPGRGRTLFERLLDSYPKRLDLKLVYVDMEAKTGNYDGMRALMERIVSSRGLSTKQAKSVFKKWLSLEKAHGTEADAARVIDRTRQFLLAAHGK